MSSRLLLWTTSSAALFAAAAFSCAGGSAEFDDDDDDGTSTSTSGGGGGAGGSTSSSGTGGDPNPCGMDCSSITTAACQISQCNAQTGQCEIVPDDDGTACDDGVFCTVSDACVAGICQPGPANDCGMTAAACEAVTCDENSQSCSTTASQNGDPCTDPNDLCIQNGACTNGLCVGTPTDCFMQPVPNECHISVCNPQSGNCEPEPGNDGGPCVDPNDLCTDGKLCDNAGNCTGGGPKDCSAFTQGCFNGACDVNTGQCFADPIAPGQQCAAATDACNQGLCDTQGACNPNPINEGNTCDDGLTCTTGTVCTSGACTGGSSNVTIHLFEDFGSNSAGWTLGTEWQIAGAQISSGHSYGNPDPGTDHTAANQNNGVAGVVIGGNAATSAIHGYYYLTSPPVDTTSTNTVFFEFYRWLNSDYTSFMQNQVQVYNGSSWVTLWESGPSPGIQDAAWTQLTHDITAHSNAALQVRFGFQIGSTGVFTVSQWNVDDVLIASAACN
ncbi:MAG: hypothetical protein JRI68_11885 [Deltaproteobacteria bacterium]|nr:hypothetical protein [Deltaproteobacteria bacterium]